MKTCNAILLPPPKPVAMKLYKSPKNMPASSAITLLMVTIIWMQSMMTLVECQNDALKTHYKHLVEMYTKEKITSDCNIGDTPGGKIDILEHGDWGTLTSLQFLSEMKPKEELAFGEAGQDFDKLRIFLARVGYLKVPGSIVFVNKQAETLRLFGCGDGAVWKMHGEKGTDPGFRETGGELKTHAPNSADYIHKFTCFKPKGKDSCSHTFYVITRMLPELPSGFQVRENDKMDDNDWRFTCAVPLCNVKQCKVTGENLNRRAYPPYTITWSVKSRAESEEPKRGDKQASLNLTEEDNKDNEKNKIKVKNGHEIRKDQEEDGIYKESYKMAEDAQWINAFGDKIEKGDVNKNQFNARIMLLGADYDLHNGPYECIIQDGNGVVSTPSVIKEGYRDWVDYRGKANIHVMRSWTSYLFFAIGIAALVLVAIIILVCPKKMEYDDGTPYTKEELKAPHAGPPQETPPSNKGSKKDVEQKTSKPKNE